MFQLRPPRGEFQTMLRPVAPPAAMKDTKTVILCNLKVGFDGHSPKNAKLKTTPN